MINSALLTTAVYTTKAAAKLADKNIQTKYHLNVVLGWASAAAVSLKYAVQEFRQTHIQ